MQADGIPALMGLLSEPCLLPYVVAVLYNLMVDYGMSPGLPGGQRGANIEQLPPSCGPPTPS